MSKTLLDILAERFCGAPLPSTVSADECATIQGYPDRRGTSLLTVAEAKTVLQHVLAPAQAGMDVLAERIRQVEVEGWTAEHDDQHECGDLACAASAYAVGDPSLWPWDPESFKAQDYRRNLVKAGALVLAELERYDRLQAENHR